MREVSEEITRGGISDRDAEAADVFLDKSYEQYGSDEDLYMQRSDRGPSPIAEKTCPYQVKKSDIVTGNKAFAKDVSVFIVLK